VQFYEAAPLVSSFEYVQVYSCKVIMICKKHRSVEDSLTWGIIELTWGIIEPVMSNCFNAKASIMNSTQNKRESAAVDVQV